MNLKETYNKIAEDWFKDHKSDNWWIEGYGYEYERFFSYYRMTELEEYLKKLNVDIVYQNAKVTGKTEWLQIVGKRSIINTGSVNY